MQIDANTTIGELSAHFDTLGDHTMKLHTVDGAYNGDLEARGNRVHVEGRTLTEVFEHFGTWTHAITLEPYQDHSAIQTSGDPGQLHKFVADRLADLGSIEQEPTHTTVSFTGPDQYWTAVRRMASFQIEFKSHYVVELDLGMIGVHAMPAE